MSAVSRSPAVVYPHGPRRGGVGWAQARRLAFDAPTPIAAHTVGLHAAAGLTLAEPVTARVDLPAFDTAAMDGFAVAGDGPHRLVGRVVAGQPAGAPLPPGHAVTISTGALVPDGVVAVVPVESAVSDGRFVVSHDVRRGQHIRYRGEDARRGDLLAAVGTPVGPALLGLAASCGYDSVAVRPRPTVQVLVTGDELAGAGVPDGSLLRDAYGPMLPSLVAGLGGRVVQVRRVPDEPAGGLAAAMRPAADLPVSVVVVTGSTSVGVTDRLRPWLREVSARLVVDQVACRPGHPQLLAELPDGQWVVGLPGNPFAGFVSALTLLGPLLAGLAGRRPPRLPHATISGDVRVLEHATRLVPVVWDGDRVQTIDGHGSAFLRGAAVADAVAAVPPGWQPETPVPLLALPADLTA